MPIDQPPTLPIPDAISAAHSEHVAAFIRQQIESSGGSISFAEFMQHALYAPGLGYYAAGSTKFGEAGDFVTAPEVSSVFGRVVARQCAEVLDQVELGALLEFGAGSGKLAADILGRLNNLDALPVAYRILEVSADLRERQEAFLSASIPELVHLVSWVDTPPSEHRGIILANEVLDALPVERFVRRESGVKQQRVCVAADGFAFAEAPAPPLVERAVLGLEADLGVTLPDGYASEICLAVPDWIAQMGAGLTQGVVFLFDYGVTRREYYAYERSNGWLRCHFRHHAHNDPLILPGIQDLTAWVDFTRVAAAAVSAGFEVAGYSPQAQFLMAGGLEAEMLDFANLSLEAQLELSQQIKTLTLPGEMGEHFKCMALRKGINSTPSAFTLADRTHTL
jgi:SAM-dependent MidA family methyltransferase